MNTFLLTWNPRRWDWALEVSLAEIGARGFLAIRCSRGHTRNKHGYQPDKQEKAAQTVIEHAGVLSACWAVA